MAETELKLCLSNEEKETKKLETLRTTVAEYETIIREKSQTVKELKEKIPQSENIFKHASNEFKKITLEESNLITKIEQNRVLLEETRSSMQASHSRNRVVEALMNEKKEGRCPGVFGRLVNKIKSAFSITVVPDRSAYAIFEFNLVSCCIYM